MSDTKLPNKPHLFQPGVSGNPSGRPKSDATIRDLARQHTPDAIDALVEIMNNKKASETARAHAATALLDRAWGRPAQYVETTTRIGTLEDYLEDSRKNGTRVLQPSAETVVVDAEVEHVPDAGI